MTTFECPFCKTLLSLPDTTTFDHFTCSTCHAVVSVPKDEPKPDGLSAMFKILDEKRGAVSQESSAESPPTPQAAVPQNAPADEAAAATAANTSLSSTGIALPVAGVTGALCLGMGVFMPFESLATEGNMSLLERYPVFASILLALAAAALLLAAEKKFTTLLIIGIVSAGTLIAAVIRFFVSAWEAADAPYKDIAAIAQEIVHLPQQMSLAWGAAVLAVGCAIILVTAVIGIKRKIS